MIEGYFGGDRDIQLVISLMDLRHPPTADDIQMVNYLIDRELPFVVVLTKLDKLNKTERQQQLALYPQALPCGDQITFLPLSSKTGEGVEDLRAIIDQLVDPPDEEE